CGAARAGPSPLEVVTQRSLCAVGGGVGAHELIYQEIEDERPHPDKRPPDSANKSPHGHLRTATPGRGGSFCIVRGRRHKASATKESIDVLAEFFEAYGAGNSERPGPVLRDQPGLRQRGDRPAARDPAVDALAVVHRRI